MKDHAMFKTINGGKLPQRATKFSAGFDVFANEDMVIDAGETKIVSLGIAIDPIGQTLSYIYSIDLNSSYYLELHPRSSLRAKGLGGGVGIIDIDYKDEILMVIANPLDRQQRYTIKRGDKIGQLILKRHEGWMMPGDYTMDEDRIGGFGSTNYAI